MNCCSYSVAFSKTMLACRISRNKQLLNDIVRCMASVALEQHTYHLQAVTGESLFAANPSQTP